MHKIKKQRVINRPTEASRRPMDLLGSLPTLSVGVLAFLEHEMIHGTGITERWLFSRISSVNRWRKLLRWLYPLKRREGKGEWINLIFESDADNSLKPNRFKITQGGSKFRFCFGPKFCGRADVKRFISGDGPWRIITVQPPRSLEVKKTSTILLTSAIDYLERPDRVSFHRQSLASLAVLACLGMPKC